MKETPAPLSNVPQPLSHHFIRFGECYVGGVSGVVFPQKCLILLMCRGVSDATGVREFVWAFKRCEDKLPDNEKSFVWRDGSALLRHFHDATKFIQVTQRF
ncbi:hypothetical protein, unlikely [Trypanosoma congolense IL3000]|uniref:Uncharacterized protein n=1 Tax=Trypanosoma congolense (strain IL3000) TaxID=1068625 RepID=F9W837_TRYCI|nr:hypothetical protein, unlikely [Trypanosoma congolense IL3000]